MKNKSVPKSAPIKEILGLCNIWLVRNPKIKVIFSDSSMSLVSFQEG